MISNENLQPHTLLEMAGKGTWLRPDTGVAVLIIDAQGEYLDGGLPLPGIENSLKEIKSLRDFAASQNWPVIHIRHIGQPGGLFDVAGRGGAFLDVAKPREGEAVIDKRLPNSFAGTELDKVLKEKEITTLIVAGFMTHMCVSATARSALDHGYSSAVIASACATRPLPVHDGGAISAEDLHRAALAGLGDRFAHILPSVSSL
ncbi:isochorismatase family protein [Stappia sp. GBMRC 2046]|uniref:Isochorismatase family protein n=1 Tax=Stappia sediminis TaxID=2692190 RepID=A0A7X3LWL5_9HYPH|nr:cysteine hydrolase family protein [Stappia sediminis]MXN66393.1 isochorismatase family protein [Stappia sediminis]